MLKPNMSAQTFFEHVGIYMFPTLTLFLIYLSSSSQQPKEIYPISLGTQHCLTLNQRQWRWLNVATTTCAQWDVVSMLAQHLWLKSIIGETTRVWWVCTMLSKKLYVEWSDWPVWSDQSMIQQSWEALAITQPSHSSSDALTATGRKIEL